MLKLLKKAVMSATDIIIDALLIIALIPTVALLVAGYTVSSPTPTTLEISLMGLTTLMIIIALVYMIVKQAGLGKKE
jgi:hypothetical protein